MVTHYNCVVEHHGFLEYFKNVQIKDFVYYLRLMPSKNWIYGIR